MATKTEKSQIARLMEAEVRSAKPESLVTVAFALTHRIHAATAAREVARAERLRLQRDVISDEMIRRMKGAK